MKYYRNLISSANFTSHISRVDASIRNLELEISNVAYDFRLLLPSLLLPSIDFTTKYLIIELIEPYKPKVRSTKLDPISWSFFIRCTLCQTDFSAAPITSEILRRQWYCLKDI